jgi:hypothetical protein
MHVLSLIWLFRCLVFTLLGLAAEVARISLAEFSFTLYAENREKLSGGRKIFFFAELGREKLEGA